MKIISVLFSATLLVSAALARWDSFDAWVCRSPFSDYCGSAGNSVDRGLQTSYTVNQYIVSGPPAVYLCGLAPACSSSPFYEAVDPVAHAFVSLPGIASGLGQNECQSLLTQFIPNGAVRSAGVCGELSNAIIECPRMPLIVLADDTTTSSSSSTVTNVLAIKRDSSMGSYWEDPPEDLTTIQGWLECGAPAQLVHSSAGDDSRWDELPYKVYWTDDDPPESGCTSTNWVPSCGNICNSGWLRWGHADDPMFMPNTDFESVPRCAGTTYPSILNLQGACATSGVCATLPWMKEYNGPEFIFDGGDPRPDPDPTTPNDLEPCTVDGLGDLDPDGVCISELQSIDLCSKNDITNSQCHSCRLCVINFLETFAEFKDSCSENEATICKELNKCDDACDVCSESIENYFDCLWRKVSIDGFGCVGLDCSSASLYQDSMLVTLLLMVAAIVI